jgi:hypothetical protein
MTKLGCGLAPGEESVDSQRLPIDRTSYKGDGDFSSESELLEGSIPYNALFNKSTSEQPNVESY